MLMPAATVTLCVLLGGGLAHAGKHPEFARMSEPTAAVTPLDGPVNPESRFALAAVETTVLASFTFDTGGVCDPQGWTVVDATAQVAPFWHVDDFVGANVNAGDSYAPLWGAQSLWCGLRAGSSGLPCSYMVLPGYGNNWNQVWQTKACIPVTGDLDVSFLLKTDSEPDYDATFLEYTTVCANPAPFSDWEVLDGGVGVWDDIQALAISESYGVASGDVRVRIRFVSDTGYSDEDGFYDSHAGPVVIDNLQVEGLALEDFEGDGLGATASDDWETYLMPGYGASYMALFAGQTLVQQDPCAKNTSCVWAAIAGSTETYACGGFPQQAAVPKGNSDGQYIYAEIWSPLIPLSGTGAVIDYQFSIYRDFALDPLVYYTWDVRAVVDGCEGPWRSRNWYFPTSQKDWLRTTFPVGDLIPASASAMRVRVGVIDLCGVWCGVYGSGACHSHAPLFDNVKVFRVDVFGPVWSTRDIDMFQDTFPADGTDTGIGRADAALSITAAASPTILPGDSARVIVSDPITAVAGTNPSGLATDNLGGTGNQAGTNGNRACYLYVHVIDSGVPSVTKTGAVLSGGPQYPFKDTVVADGKAWTRIQCWLRVNTTSTFVVDLNDNLFEAGDVIEFFFGATSTSGHTSYASGSSLRYVQSNLELAAEVASEFTILPLDQPGDILYVDGMDGRGAQEYWDTAFETLGLGGIAHRYDVRGPTLSVSNRPGTRVTDVAIQLNGHYKRIIWDCGDIVQGLGDGTGAPDKSNDYAIINEFLAGLTTPGGIYICGDDQPAGLNSAGGASAVTFKTTYLGYSLTTGNHRPGFGVSPLVTGAGGYFGTDTFFAYGGCPLFNDFDVMTPTGSTSVQMTYGAATGTNAAVIGKANGNARVTLSGFGFIYIRDDDEDGVMDRARHLRDILCSLGDCEGNATSAPSASVTRLEQNYPNPFNPMTTIAFSIQERARVRIDVFDVAGKRVKALLDEPRAAGSYADVRWDGTNDVNHPVASGVYWYRLVAGDFSQSRKMVLLK